MMNDEVGDMGTRYSTVRKILTELDFKVLDNLNLLFPYKLWW